MLQENYENILKKISKVSGISEDELDQRVEAKRAKLSGLISKEGAAQIIAAELGISFDKEKLKISELLSGMKRVNVISKILQIFPVRSFIRNGNQNKVVNLLIADETGNIKTVLWDSHHIGLIEKKEIKEGDVIEILNASVRDNEIHLGSFSEFRLSNEIINNVKTERVIREKKISEIRNGDSIKIRAFIMQIFDPRFFDVCPECKKKVTFENNLSMCNEHGKIIPERRVLLNFVIDDGTENIRSVIFTEQLNQLGLNPEDINVFIEQKQNLIGKEFFLSGNVRQNKLFNNLEFIADKIDEIDLDALIKELENRK